MAENEPCDDGGQQLITLLDSLKRSSEDLQTKPLYLPLDFDSPTVGTLLEIDAKSNTLLAQDPDLSTLSRLVSQIKNLIIELKSSQSYSLRSFLYRRLVSYQISCAAISIYREIQSWVDKHIVRDLVQTLQESVDDDAEEDKLRLLARFERRVSMGFDKDLQELILKEKVFPVLESVLCDSSCSTPVRENSAIAISALARFNRNVFVGLVLMGFTIRALVSLGTSASLLVLTSLIKLIRAHLVDEMELNGEIPRVISKLSSDDPHLREVAMDCICEMGYHARKEVIETMFVCGLVEKLVCLQRVDLIRAEGNKVDERNGGGDVGGSSDIKDGEALDQNREDGDEDHPLSRCVARLAVQVEIGEGMDKSEKKAVKMEILRRAREACVSEAEAAAIVAEVLWGSSP